MKLSEPKYGDRHLAIASRITFPLEALELVQHTPRFRASFAIEVLRRAIVLREDAPSLAKRHKHAIATVEEWAESFA